MRDDLKGSSPGFARQALEWWRQHMRGPSGLERIDADELEHMARELSLSAKDLASLDLSGPQGGELMARMMVAKGVDIGALRKAYPLVVRDMEKCCTFCNAKARCRRELDSGAAAAHFQNYCVNAPTIVEFAADNPSGS